MGYFFDSNQVRYELVKTSGGKALNWLFLPGGPGADSSYFHSLIDLLDLPGNVWCIDLPGNGSNIENVADDYDYDEWFSIFVSAVERFENPILVGQSFGGMFPLMFPELEKLLKGLVILNSAPKLWMEKAVEYAQQFNLPDLSVEMAEFTATPNQETFDAALAACMPYYFRKDKLEEGRAFLLKVPFQFKPAVWWQRKAVELDFSAKWVPQDVPTVIVGGKYDCICPFSLFKEDQRFNRENIDFFYGEEAGHCPWVESPDLCLVAFEKLLTSLSASKKEACFN